MKKTIYIGLRIEPDLYNRLARLAKAQKRSISDTIRLILAGRALSTTEQ